MSTQNTALVLIDVYNDFLHPKGRVNGALAPSLEKFGTIANLKRVLEVAHSKNIPVYYSLHQQYHDGKFAGFKHWNAMLKTIESGHGFEEGKFGSQVYEGLEPDASKGDTIISKHWNSSSFQNTDLDWLLRQKDITHVVFAGLVANTCIETTARMANELEYHVTMLKDATAGWTIDSMEAAINYSWPAFAHEVLSTEEWIQSVA